MTLKRGYAMTGVFFVLSLICVAVIHSAERQIKKPKIDKSDAVCKPLLYVHHYVDRDRIDFTVAHALLSVGLYAELIDTIYDYISDIVYPTLVCHLREERVSWKVDGKNASRVFVCSERSLEASFIVPPDTLFDDALLCLANKVSEIACEYPGDCREHPSKSLTSLCQRYCLNFKFQAMTVSTLPSKLSASHGWKQALAELNTAKNKKIDCVTEYQQEYQSIIDAT